MTKDLNQEIAKWYSKLAKEGFHDIEVKGEHGPLEPEVDIRNSTLKVASSHREYYQQASDYLNTAKFENELELEVWKLFCDGVSVRVTAELLDKSKSAVHRIITRHKKLAGM